MLHKSAIYIFAAFCALAIPACSHHDGEEHHDGHDEHEHSEHEHDGHNLHDEHGHSDEIILEPEMAQRMGVKVATVKPGDFAETVAVSGRLMPSPLDVAVATAPTSGIVSFASGISDGASVGQGTMIATVTGKSMTGGDANSVAAANLETARRELERAKPLHEQGIMSVKEYNEILGAYEAAKSAFSPQAASGKITAPIAGTISAMLVRQGGYVEAGEPVAQITRSTRLTLRADLPERFHRLLPTIRSASFRAAGSDNFVNISDLGGSLAGNPSTATATDGYFPVYFTFNSRGDVAPGSYAEVYLIGAQRHGVVTIPVAAITEQAGGKYVYVQIDDEGYERRFVTLGGSDGTNVEVLSGINPGDRLVVEGASAVRLAENSGSIPEGHSHNH